MQITFDGADIVEEAFVEINNLDNATHAEEESVLDLERQMLELDSRIMTVQLAVKGTEAAIMQTITTQMDATGKKMYPNAETRKAELERRMLDHDTRREVAKLVQEKVDVEREQKTHMLNIKMFGRRSRYLYARIEYLSLIMKGIGQ
jgi:hypothetical protein|tara:strand:+ start:5030 stop:5470 length:441 start_codon:yes stop_codon:yes gene_type:complete